MSVGVDPGLIGTEAEYLVALRQVRAWAGNPSFEVLARRTGTPRSTLHDALKPSRTTLPRLEVVASLVRGCGLDQAATNAWVDAWKRVQAARTTTPAPDVRSDLVEVPQQLPMPVRDFVGRESELDGLERWAADPDTSPVMVLCGTGGVGKTALAVRWAESADFPDGRIYLDLHGFDGQDPVEPANALGRLIRSMVAPGVAIPIEIADLQARLKTLLADRRMLIVLDNAASAAQVEPLLPGPTNSRIIVTSRDWLSPLLARHGAHRIRVEPMPDHDSTTLLNRLIGPKAPSDDEVLSAIADRCAHLPLALRICAELVAVQADRPLADVLADLDHPLDYLDLDGSPGSSMRAVLAASHQRLPGPSACALALFGTVPALELDEYAFAALTDDDLAPARRHIRILSQAGLIEHRANGHIGLHDLVKEFTRQLAVSRTQRDSALDRLADYYAAASRHASVTAMPHLTEDELGSDVLGLDLPVLTGALDARTWLQTESVNLATVVDVLAHANRWRRCLDIVLSLDRFLIRHGERQLLSTFGERGVEAATELGDDRALGRANRRLGRARAMVGDFDAADSLLDQARGFASRSNDSWGLLAARVTQMSVVAARNEIDAEHQMRALIAETTAERRFGLSGSARTNLSHLLLESERYEDAYEMAVAACRDYAVAEDYGEPSVAWSNMAIALAGLGRVDEARDALARATEIAQDVGYETMNAGLLISLAALTNRAGDKTRAAEHLRQAQLVARKYGDAGFYNNATAMLTELQ